MGLLLTDLRDAWRGLRAAPGSSLLALAILTLGIAAATVTFSVVDTVALRGMPFPEASRLAAIAIQERGSPRLGTSAPQDFFTWRAQTPAFEGVAAWSGGGLQYASGGTTEQLIAPRITANLFDVLRVRPALGTTFSAAHEQAGQDQVVILSHGAWQRLFAGDPGIVGRPVTFGKAVRTVVGVMPEGFSYPVGRARATDAWVPYVPRPRDLDHASAGRGYSLEIVARLKPDATLVQARGQVERATAAVVAAYPSQSFWKDSRPVVMSLQEFVVGPPGRWLVLVLGAVALVLLIAYVNVANLLVARATVRARELALRAVLGAGRARIIRMLMAESLMLSLAAAALGIVFAIWGVSIATAGLPAGLARATEIAMDLRVLSVAIAAAVLTGLLFGVMPAWQGSRADVMTVMKDGGAIGAGGRRARWQRALLVAELAFVATLLVAASLFVTSFVKVLQADLGFARENLAAVPVSRSLSAVPEADRPIAVEAFVSDVLTRARAVPGVTGAAIVDGNIPLFGGMVSYSIKVDGFGETNGADMPVLREVTPDYFAVAGVPLVYGRTFDAAERAGALPVAIINDEAVRRFFGGRNPVGERIEFRQAGTTIVGVVRSVRMSGPEVDLRPEIYVPLAYRDLTGDSVSGDLVVRLASSAPGLVASVRDAVRPVNTSTVQPRDLNERFRVLTADRRFNAGVMTIFGLVALAIAAVGVYGLTSFVVAQQTRAIGVRLALGATAGRIFRGVLAESGKTLAIAMTLGLLGGWAASRLFQSVVFGVTGGEVWLYAGVVLILAVTVVLATVLPARRASRVDPLVALRTD
jgi:predicted permease